MSNSTDFDGVNRGSLPAGDRRTLRLDSGMQVEVLETRQGGMGMVYLGRLSAGDREIDVAVKVIRPELLLDSRAQTAFRDEVSVWSRLSGTPFVFPLLKVDKLGGQLHLLTMRVMPDKLGVVSLRDRIRLRPPMTSAEVYAVAFAMATGLARANKVLASFSHGDIKPENVLMMGGVAHIADFGIAKALQPSQRHQPKGTPGYLAPEAVDGDLSEGTDIFAFGRTIQECLGTLEIGRQEDDSLREALSALGDECTRQEPSGRPEGFGWIAAKLFIIGMQLAPTELEHLTGFCKFCDDQTRPDDTRFALETGRIRDLLEAGKPGDALDVLNRIAESDRTAELWLLAGTSHSLAGDDQLALDCFDRCTSLAGPDDEIRTRCASERGLSLRRLNRYDEAIQLYEHLLSGPLGSMLATVMANYTATLLDSGRLEDAKRRANWLTDKFDDHAAAWTLRGQIERKMGQHEQALRSLRRSIELEPVSYHPHMAMGEILQFEYGNLEDALEHFDLAFASGEHTPALLTSLLSVNLLLGNQQDVAGILESLSGAPKDIADRITREFVSQVQKFRARFGDSETGGTASSEAEAETGDLEPAEDSHTAKAGGPKVMVLETAVIFAEDGGQVPMMGCRAFLTSEFFAIDYFDGESAQYSERFGRAFVQFSQEIALKFGKLHLRNSMLKCARCEHCGFAVLTNREEIEQLLCRMCDRRGRVIPERSPSAQSLVEACEKAAQLKRSAVSGNEVILSLWPPSAGEIDAVRNTCTQAGWQIMAEDTVAPALASHLGQSRGASVTSPPALQVKVVLPPGEESYGGTPWSVQRLLMALHPQFGAFPTTSMVIPADWARYLTSSSDEALDSIRKEIGANPESAEDLATLISLALRDDLETARKLVGLSFQISASENTRLHVARGLFYIKTGDLVSAERALRRAKELAPLDAGARLALIQLWQASGLTAEEAKETNELRAIGIGSILGRA